MQYVALNPSDSFGYPSHDINPDLKGKDWCMAYARAAYFDWTYGMSKGVFSANGGDYAKYRMYGLGKQPIDQYKNWMGVDSVTNETQLVVDWKIRAIVSGYRDKAIARCMKEDYGIIATPIDMEAKSEMESYYATLRTKLAIRELMLQSNTEMASHPMITLQSGEPLDIEELEMRMELGEQFNRAKDAEMAIDLGFYENDYKSWRRQIYEDLFDLGIAGTKDWLGDDNKAKFRVVDPENVITSVSQDGTFKNIVHAGEQIYVPLTELATVKDEDGNLVFTDKDLTEFASSICRQWGNPSQLGSNSGTSVIKPFDRFKAAVLDIEFFTYNENVYRTAKDGNGNEDFRKADYGRGKTSDNYSRKKIQYVYKCKWIVGTDKCYDWGMCYDQKRSIDPKKKAQTRLSYNFFAYNFYQMRAQGFMERLIPYLDDYQLTMLKIQNFKNRAVPSGWWIDLSRLEATAMNKGGKNMTPWELLQMFFETGVLLGRSEQEGGGHNNLQPVIPIENTAASELAMFYQDLINTITAIEKMTGYNDVTMGQASSKTLVPGYETAQQSTNEALAPLAFAEEYLSLKLAENVLCRMQQGIKKGGISGYAPALNTNLLRFIQISPGLALREYGIMLEKKTSDDQKAILLQLMQGDIAQGYLSSVDVITIINTKNAKQAQEILAFKVDREKKRQSQQKMSEIQATNQGNLQAAQVAQQTAMQTMQMQGQIELQKKQLEVQGEIEKTRMKIESDERIAMSQNYAKLQVAETTGAAKIHSTDLQGQHAQVKQVIANNKPTSSN